MKLLLLLFFLCIVKVIGSLKQNQPSNYFSADKEGHLIWSQLKNNSWVCGSKIRGAILCKRNFHQLKISRCYCIYYDTKNNVSQFGSCFATCFYPSIENYLKLERLPIENASFFNNAICNASYITYRTGRFCGKCMDGYGLAVYSYDFSVCIPCKRYSYRAWLEYFSISLIPLTIFYLVTVLLRINFTSNKLNGVLLVIQVAMSPLNLQLYEAWMNSKKIYPAGRNALRSITGIFGIFNLDFLRDIYPKFCISPDFTILQVTALDFIPALYPFFLIFLTYFLIWLYDKNISFIVRAWKPFKYCLSGYYRQLNVRTSLVETFASFILLSSIKLASVSLTLLMVTHIYDVSGKPWHTSYLYYDSNIEFFGKQHLPYGLLAIFVLIVFVISPVLLMVLYPCTFFHKALNVCGCNSQVLRILMDAFQGSYKTKPRDMRYFSAYYLLLRYTVILITGYIQSTFALPAATIVVISSTFVITLLQPHRNHVHNKLDILAINILAFSFSSTLLMMSIDIYWLYLSNSAFALAQLIIVAYFIGIFIWSLFELKIYGLWHRCKSCFSLTNDVTHNSVEHLTRERLSDDTITEASILIQTNEYQAYT